MTVSSDPATHLPISQLYPTCERKTMITVIHVIALDVGGNKMFFYLLGKYVILTVHTVEGCISQVFLST